MQPPPRRPEELDTCQVDGAQRRTAELNTWPAAPRRREETAAVEGRICVICADREADAVLYRCGHRCACLRCAHYLRHDRQPCPVCRAPIDDVLRIFE